MFNFKIIPHKDLKHKYLDEIIQVKSIAWPYSYEKQIDWIYTNIKDCDNHVLMYLDELLIAYLNLIEIEFTIDGNLKNGYGIGNVCAREKSKGFGKELIVKTNSYLIQKNRIGLLFCKETLVDFYKSNNWILIEKKKITLSFNSKTNKTMIFNWNEDFQHIEFLGKSF